MGDIQDRSFSARLNCHYSVVAPDSIDSYTLLVVALHGFSANPEAMLKLTARLFERPAVIAALQGQNQFFLGSDTCEVDYGWITSRHPAESVRLHHEMVLFVADEANLELRRSVGCWSGSPNQSG